MGIWDVALGYTALRTVLAFVIGWVASREGRPLAPRIAQGVSDIGCAGLLTACVDYRVREVLGWTVVPLAAYVIAWEAWSALRDSIAAPADQPDHLPSEAAILGRGLRFGWRLLFVVPPLGAGLLLVFGVMAPGNLRFPGERPPMLCRPAELGAGDTLVVEMTVPHGGELTVTDPRGRTTVLLPFAPAAVPADQRFDNQKLVRLPVERVAAAGDTGTYVLYISSVGELSGTTSCRVRVSAPTAAAPPPTQ
jgi:hypothetical protein